MPTARRPENLLTPVRYPSDAFSRQGLHFVTEASDLNGRPWFNSEAGRVYNDACDTGFTLVGTANGKEAVFALTNVDTDPEGDVRAWEFTCVYPPILKLAGLTAAIFND